jgi:hypothetical protein
MVIYAGGVWHFDVNVIGTNNNEETQDKAEVWFRLNINVKLDTGLFNIYFKIKFIALNCALSYAKNTNEETESFK